jgi:hypothetical protein
VGGEAIDAVAEQLQPDLAFDAMRAGDTGERNPTRSSPGRGGGSFAKRN